MSEIDHEAVAPDHDPGEAVPAGVTVGTPEKPSEPDRAVQEKVEHLRNEHKTPG